MTFSRRHFLRTTTLSTLGAASFYFLDPLGRSLLRHAQASDAMPKRLVLFVDSQGWASGRRRPKALKVSKDAVNEVSLLDAPLHTSLKPLDEFRDRMLMLEPFYNPFGKGLHGNGWATLTVQPPFENKAGGDLETTSPPGGQTIDRLIARTISEGASLRSLNVGLHKEGTRSADGPNIMLPTRQDPFEVFQQLFAGSSNPEYRKQLEDNLRRRKSIFDQATDDLTALRRRLPTAEKAKLEQFSTTMREVELSLGRILEQRACTEVGEPPKEGMTDVHGKSTYRGAVIPEIAYAHVDIVAQALVCGLTNVAALALTPGTAHFKFLGATEGKHQLNHGGSQDLLTVLDAWHAERVASLCRQLDAVPEGDGTMLDNTLVVWLNVNGGQHHNGFGNHPAMVIGNVGGKLKTGRAIAYKGVEKTGERCISDFYTSLLEVFDVPVETFGDPEHSKGKLSEIFA